MSPSLELGKRMLKELRIVFINFGYRNNCDSIYWAIYLLWNIPFCSVYNDVLEGDDDWMYNMSKHFSENLQKLERDVFENRKYIRGVK